MIIKTKTVVVNNSRAVTWGPRDSVLCCVLLNNRTRSKPNVILNNLHFRHNIASYYDYFIYILPPMKKVSKEINAEWPVTEQHSSVSFLNESVFIQWISWVNNSNVCLVKSFDVTYWHNYITDRKSQVSTTKIQKQIICL